EVQPGAAVPEPGLAHVLVGAGALVHLAAPLVLEELLLVLGEGGGGSEPQQQDRRRRAGGPIPSPSHSAPIIGRRPGRSRKSNSNVPRRSASLCCEAFFD